MRLPVAAPASLPAMIYCTGQSSALTQLHAKCVPRHCRCLQNADPDQPVMIYCTGGIRCDVYGTYLRQKG